MIVATMASLSSREHLLEQVVASLLPQVDALCVYLNGHRTIPRCLGDSKVVWAVLSAEHGIRGGEAKLLFWDRDEWKAAPYWSDNDIAIIVDDDIIYPPDYVARHVAALQTRPRTVSCVHGSILTAGYADHATDRMVARCRERLATDARVHLPGAGTMAFRRGDFDVSLRRDQRWSHCVDIMTGITAKQQGLEVWALSRGEAWLRPLALPNGTSVYRMRTGAGNTSVETRAVIEAGPWPELEVVAGMTPRSRTVRANRPPPASRRG